MVVVELPVGHLPVLYLVISPSVCGIQSLISLGTSFTIMLVLS